jgi:hypothetical protein
MDTARVPADNETVASGGVTATQNPRGLVIGPHEEHMKHKTLPQGIGWDWRDLGEPIGRFLERVPHYALVAYVAHKLVQDIFSLFH